MFEHELGADSPRVGTALNNLGHALLSADRCDEARPVFEQALQVFQKRADPVATDLSTPLYNLAYCAVQGRDFAAADGYTARALEVLAAASDTLESMHLRFLRSRALHGLGRDREAAALLEQVLAFWQHTTPVPDRRGDARFVLAQALWSGDIDRARAVAEARSARESLRTASNPMIPLADVDAWLAAHDR